MSMTFTTFRTHHGSRWSQMKRRFAEWRRRAYSRRELQRLSDATLRDIGISGCDAQRESTKPFWMT